MNDFVWPSDLDRAENDELNRVCEYLEEVLDYTNGAEPVAFGIFYKGVFQEHGWSFDAANAIAAEDYAGLEEITVEPVYTHPQPAAKVPQETEAMVDAAVKVFEDAGVAGDLGWLGEACRAYVAAASATPQQSTHGGPIAGCHMDEFGDWVQRVLAAKVPQETEEMVDAAVQVFESAGVAVDLGWLGEACRAYVAAAPTTPQQSGEWAPNSEGPTSWEFRFVEALRVLCGGVEPPDSVVKNWLHDQDSVELQEWAVSHTAFHWAMGITTIEAAMSLAGEPDEGGNHEAERPNPPKQEDE